MLQNKHEKAIFSFGDLTHDASFTKFQNQIKKQTPLQQKIINTNLTQQNIHQYSNITSKQINQLSRIQNKSQTNQYNKKCNNSFKPYSYNPTVQQISKKYGFNINQKYSDIKTKTTQYTNSQSSRINQQNQIRKSNLVTVTKLRINEINNETSRFRLEQLSPHLVQSSQRGEVIVQELQFKNINKETKQTKQKQNIEISYGMQQNVKNAQAKLKINSINELNEKINNKLKSILKGRRLY